jgi:hypothetical protein
MSSPGTLKKQIGKDRKIQRVLCLGGGAKKVDFFFWKKTDYC